MVNVLEVTASRTKRWLSPKSPCSSAAKHLCKSLTPKIMFRAALSVKSKIFKPVFHWKFYLIWLRSQMRIRGSKCHLNWNNSCESHPWKLKSKACVAGDSVGGGSQASWGWRINAVHWDILVAPPETKTLRIIRFEDKVTWPLWCDFHGRISWKCTCCTNGMKIL